MTTIFLQRHGIAEGGGAGVDRHLTRQGSAELAAAAAGLAAAGMRVEAACHSPLARTRQTAEHMQPVLAPGAESALCPPLAPGVDPAALMGWLRAHLGDLKPVLLVGHMPDVAVLVALWATGTAGGQIAFDPGTLARLDFPGGRIRAAAGHLRWLIPAALLRHARAPLLA